MRPDTEVANTGEHDFQYPKLNSAVVSVQLLHVYKLITRRILGNTS